MTFYDKKSLYRDIDAKLCEFGVDFDWYPLNVNDLADLCDIEVVYTEFKSEAIGAVLLKGNTKSGMLVNSGRPLYDQRFDIAHELIHFWIHPIMTSFSLDTPVKRDKSKEWQANEGAAQLLLPYKDFIPRFLSVAAYVEENYEPAENIYLELAKHYKVNPIVVDYRIQTLDNEILQYVATKDIDKIVLRVSQKLFIKGKPISVNKRLIDDIKQKNS